MDRKYIENEHIVDRYMSGDLTVREARDFEKYCVEHPEILSSLPIPVRLKARLAKKPVKESETGVFPAIPSSASREAVEAHDEGFDATDEHEAYTATYGHIGRPGRLVSMMLGFAVIAAIAVAVYYAMQVSGTKQELITLRREMRDEGIQAPGAVRELRLQLSRAKPEAATAEIGWPNPPQLLDLYVDVSEGRYTQFMITIDKVDAGRIMQIRRVARDSNREVRFGLNSSAFGRGEYLMRFEGYNWRGQTDEIGWVRLQMR
jgi:hypothetical protein